MAWLSYENHTGERYIYVFICFTHANYVGRFPLDLVSKTREDGNHMGLILESTAMLTLVTCSQRVQRYYATDRINPIRNGNSWNNHCLEDSSVLWNGNYFKTHSVLPCLPGILDIRKVLLYLNCTLRFSVPWLFIYMVCKSPNVPGFESPANSFSGSGKTCIWLVHFCSLPKGQPASVCGITGLPTY